MGCRRVNDGLCDRVVGPGRDCFRRSGRDGLRRSRRDGLHRLGRDGLRRRGSPRLALGLSLRRLEIERLWNVPAAVMNVGPGTDGGQVFGGDPQDRVELLLRLVELLQLDQRARERDLGRDVRGMALQTATADVDGVLKPSNATVFFGEGCEGDGRRVGVDPTSQIVNPGVRHDAGDSTAKRAGRYVSVTTMARVTVPLSPESSVTVSVTK